MNRSYPSYNKRIILFIRFIIDVDVFIYRNIFINIIISNNKHFRTSLSSNAPYAVKQVLHVTKRSKPHILRGFEKKK